MKPGQVIERYHQAWTGGDFVTARASLADDLDFRGSIDTFSNADEFIAALQRFSAMLKGVTLLQNCHDDKGGALLYDCDTAGPAGVIRTAEFFTVSDGRISAIRLVFDATELRKAMQG
jgi:hypothetical protein